MNRILKQVIESRQGHYCHALEVYSAYDLQCAIDSLYDDFTDSYSKEEIIDFIDNMELYCLIDGNEEEVYNFDIKEYITSL